MLLFIIRAFSNSGFPNLFQYISCYCLSAPTAVILNQKCISIHLMLLFIDFWRRYRNNSINFNTSHVTVYHWADNTVAKGITISIHLMLLFITSAPFFVRVIFHFNTSHVTVYQGLLTSQNWSVSISIHLMLLFIEEEVKPEDNTVIFQYISCYCLSHGSDFTVKRNKIFQYISCYCLSFFGR